MLKVLATYRYGIYTVCVDVLLSLSTALVFAPFLTRYLRQSSRLWLAAS